MLLQCCCWSCRQLTQISLGDEIWIKSVPAVLHDVAGDVAELAPGAIASPLVAAATARVVEAAATALSLVATVGVPIARVAAPASSIVEVPTAAAAVEATAASATSGGVHGGLR